MKFSDLGLSEAVLQAVAEAGYSEATPIQQQAIPHVLMGRDVLGTAQTGTGKTAGFTLPLVDILSGGRARARMPRALILEPTRELADQVSVSFETYGKYSKLTKTLLIGGVAYGDQEKALDRGVDVLIATPGRLLDHFGRGKVLLGGVQILVIDEADRMLDMGFIPDIEKIVRMLPTIRQTLLFSATMPPEIRKLADAFMSNPKQIAVAAPAAPAALVVQRLVRTSSLGPAKRTTLRKLLQTEPVKNAIIFCNRKRDVDILAKSLAGHGFNTAALHGDMPQDQRTATLERFKAGQITLLVASDVAARGLDVVGMSHVFNFDVPIHAEDYVHRIGRTGRAGLEGHAFTLASGADEKYLAAITKLIGVPIPEHHMGDAAYVEGSDAEAAHAGDRRSGSGASSGRRPRSSQGEKPSRGGKSHHRPKSAPSAPSATTTAPVAKPARSTEPSPPVRSPVKSGAPISAAPISTDGPRQRASTDQARDDGNGKGFADHLPAFLARPTRRS
jgi:superfamily II DNA/RNA helicase